MDVVIASRDIHGMAPGNSIPPLRCSHKNGSCAVGTRDVHLEPRLISGLLPIPLAWKQSIGRIIDKRFGCGPTWAAQYMRWGEFFILATASSGRTE